MTTQGRVRLIVLQILAASFLLIPASPHHCSATPGWEAGLDSITADAQCNAVVEYPTDEVPLLAGQGIASDGEFETQRAPVQNPRWYTMFTRIPADWSTLARRTFRSESIPTLAGVAGITGILYMVDERTYHTTHAYPRRSHHVRRLSDAIVSLGDGKYQFGFIGTLALYGFLDGDSRVLRTASQMTEAVISTGIVVQVLKRITGRESPIVATASRGAVRPFPNLTDYEHHQPKYYSFPSGHVATTTASLTVLCENFPEARWMRPVSYLAVGAVGGSLVSKGWHWYSDLPLGIALGYSLGMIAAHPEGADIGGITGDHSVDFFVSPAPMSNGAELDLAVHF